MSSKTISKDETLNRINKLEIRLLPLEYLKVINRLYFSAREYYLYHSNTALHETLTYLLKLPNNTWIDYYPLGRNELTSNMEINKDLEEIINLYLSLLKKYSELVIEFSNSILNGKNKSKEYYENLLITRKVIDAFDPSDMANGLLNERSYANFKTDISLMRLVNTYFETGKINKWEIKKLNGYPRLWPWVKIDIYNTMANIFNQANNKQVKILVRK